MTVEQARATAREWRIRKDAKDYLRADELRALLWREGYLLKVSRSGRTRLERYPTGEKIRA